MQLYRLSWPEVIALAYAQLGQPSSWPESLAETQVTGYRRPTRERGKSDPRLYASDSRGGKRPSSGAREQLTDDCLTVVKAIRALDAPLRQWAEYRHTDDGGHHHARLVQQLLAAVDGRLAMPDSWRGKWELSYKIVRLADVYLAAERQGARLSRQQLARAVDLTSEANFRNGKPWALYHQALEAVVADWERALAEAVHDAVVCLRT